MFLQLHVTGDCNLKCAHCYEKETRFPDSKELTTAEFKGIITEFSSMCSIDCRPGLVYLTGGEPFMRSDLFDLVAHCRGLGLGVRILTNGTLVDSAMAARLREADVTGVQVSLDGLEPTHDSIRGLGAYEKAVSGIRELLRHDVPVTVMTTVGTHNSGEVLRLWTDCVGMGVKRLAMGRLVPVGRGAGLGHLVMSPDECKELFESVAAFEGDLAGAASVMRRDPLWRILDGGRLPDCAVAGCSIGLNGICVLQNGDILPCRRLPIRLANVRDESISHVWATSELLESLRARALDGACGDCGLRSKCGGCRGIAYASGGDCLGPDPQCFIASGSDAART
jgi:radical SAM protein with 4Fe4S-binding SPASM domain